MGFCETPTESIQNKNNNQGLWVDTGGGNSVARREATEETEEIKNTFVASSDNEPGHQDRVYNQETKSCQGNSNNHQFGQLSLFHGLNGQGFEVFKRNGNKYKLKNGNKS